MSYATVNDLSSYLGAEAPANAEYLLSLASDIVDDLLIGTIYDTDDYGWPSDDETAAAIVKATCAQAAYMSAVGDPTGAEAATTAATTVKIGEVSKTSTRFGSGNKTGARAADSEYAPNAVRVLRVAGLTPFATTWGY